MNWNEFISPVVLSVQVAAVASVAVFVLGSSAARLVGRRPFRGRTALETLFMLPLVLPPTVVGFILLVLLGKKGIVGALFEALFARSLVFTWWAAVVAAVVVAFPLVYQTMKTGFAAVDPHLEDAARSAGATEWQVLRYVTLPLARRSLATAFILGFARALGEFGATLMVAGNIPGKTQTLPTAIYVAAESGHLTEAWWWAGTIVALSFLMLLAANGRRSVDETKAQRYNKE